MAALLEEKLIEPVAKLEIGWRLGQGTLGPLFGKTIGKTIGLAFGVLDINRKIFLPSVLWGIEELYVFTGQQTWEEAWRDTEYVLNSRLLKFYDEMEADVNKVINSLL